MLFMESSSEVSRKFPYSPMVTNWQMGVLLNVVCYIAQVYLLYVSKPNARGMYLKTF